MDFASKYLKDNNYVAVYKRKGEDKNILKVDKPAITAVSVNREDQSPFLKKVDEMPESPIAPMWLDFNKDIDKFLIEMRKKYPNLRITESGRIGISKDKTIGTSMGEL